jgi:16S rRNA (guanine527-N7)-methyltransferase
MQHIDTFLDYIKDWDIPQENVDKIWKHAQMVLDYTKKINLISPGDKDKILLRHTLDALQVFPFLSTQQSTGKKYLDMGSGSGFPLIPICILFPEIQFTSIEPRVKRVAFLSAVKRELKLTNLKLMEGRAEDLQEKYDFVSSRALGSFQEDWERAKSLLNPQGYFITFKHGQDSLPPEAQKTPYSLPGEKDSFYLVSVQYNG